MFSDLTKPQRIFMLVLLGLTAIAVSFGIFAGYNLAMVAKPWTIGVTYADKLTYDENQAHIMNVKISSNQNNNGEPVYDLLFNSYSDSDAGGVIGFGIQCVGDWGVYNLSNIDRQSLDAQSVDKWRQLNQLIDAGHYKYFLDEDYQTLVFGDFKLYATGDNGTTYYSIDYSRVNNFLLIDINGQYYKISLKTYTYTTYETSGMWWWKSTEEINHTYKFTWFEVFDVIMYSAINNSGSEEFSKYALPLFDLSQFITIEYLHNGQYKQLDATTENRNYMTIPVEYSKDGAVKASDSLFKIVKGSASWSYYEGTEVEDFWAVVATIDVTEKNIKLIEAGNEWYITLDDKYSKYLSNLSGVEISVNINLDNLDKTLSGIIMDKFTFKVKEFNITSANPQSFAVLNKSTIEPNLIFGGDK